MYKNLIPTKGDVLLDEEIQKNLKGCLGCHWKISHIVVETKNALCTCVHHPVKVNCSKLGIVWAKKPDKNGECIPLKKILTKEERDAAREKTAVEAQVGDSRRQKVRRTSGQNETLFASLSF